MLQTTPVAPQRRLPAWAVLLCAALLLLAGLARAPAAAAAAAPVRYDAASNTIFVGADYADPGLAGYPSQTGAPKSPITIPQVAAALASPSLLQDQGGGAWLLRANLVISATARLDATAPSIGWLRLASEPAQAPLAVVASGGWLNIQGIKVTSWQTISNTADLNYADGRAYLLALGGGRMDVVNAEVAYLGWSAGEPSGLSWRERATPSDPRTGATGSITGSDIHDNYFGMFAYAAYKVAILNSAFHNNIGYGVDPHTGTVGFEVAFNQVYSNGTHGIIFSRDCVDNNIHDNTVFDNTEHGIMLDRGSDNNRIVDNTVYNNSDGIAVFQSSGNLIQGNTLHDNNVGVRINATYDQNDIFDGISTGNTLTGNTIENSAQYGIYLYERADRNTIAQNSVSGSGAAGVYIKTGGNAIQANQLRLNGTGISIVGGPLTPIPPGGPKPVPALEQPGDRNTIAGNTIADNDTTGVQLKGATRTVIGQAVPGAPATDGNTIRTNGTYGITMSGGSADTTVRGNQIEANGNAGVLVKDAASQRNRISRNTITANGGLGIGISGGANGGLAAPTITSAPNAPAVAGKAPPSANVEVYRDPAGQGQVFVGSTSASAAGDWSLALPPGDNPQAGGLTAVAIAANGNTSAFGGNTLGGARAIYTVGAGRNGELTVFISGPSANVTLPDIKRALDVISPTASLLEDQGGGVWQANASLFFNRGVTLTLTLDTAKWLKLRSQASPIHVGAAAAGASAPGAYDYDSFVTLRTYNGAILIDGTRVTSWDPQLNTYDTDVANGRSYVIAKYQARLDIKNADMSYLGSADGESYGVAWRDINDDLAPDVLLTRVTGTVLNSTFSHNYYGIYTFQASNMVFRGNQFHHNIGYGFDPHDFSHHFTIEDNQSYANGNHGFIISRGCNNFVFRRNQSHDNHYTIGTDIRRAHGFILDPGSPNSAFAQAPSHDNLLEDNQAWNNDGYGVRILGSNNNTVRNNQLTGNFQGVTIEQGGTGNVIQGNTIAGSGQYGVYLIGGSDGNTIQGNTIAGSGKHGIYLKTGHNTVTQNIVSENGRLEIGAGIATLQETAAAAALDAALAGPPGGPTLTSPVAGNVITQNTLVHNTGAGIELKGASATQVEGNTTQLNGANGIYLSAATRGSLIRRNVAFSNVGYGIRSNGADVSGNRWVENSVYANSVGGIATTGGSAGGVRPPTIAAQGLVASGVAAPGATVEIFSDDGKQARYFEGRVVAGQNGAFSFTAAQPWHGRNINATATDTAGNSSALAFNVGQFVAFAKVYLPLARH
jgi:parallel beta-helix repeat protein